MQIISSKKLLFQDSEYHDEIVDDKATGRKVHNVKASVTVEADPRPQIVPDWVKNDELFKLCVEDGSIIEVVGSSKPAKPNAGLKGVTPDANVPDKAKFVDNGKKDDSDSKPAGWGATGSDVN